MSSHSNLKQQPIHLYCFPFAGGSSQLYANWKNHPKLAQVVMLMDKFELPGRSRRIEEEPLRDIKQLAESLFQEIQKESAGAQVILFGHSFGGLLAFEVGLRLEAAGRAPLAVFVSAMNPPHMRPTPRKVSAMKTHEIIDYFAGNGFELPKALLEDLETLEVYLRTIKADYAALEAYEPSQQKNLSCPLVAFGGREDNIINPGNLLQWYRHTKGKFSIELYDNQGHYYIKDKRIFEEIGDFIFQTIKDLSNSPATTKVISGTNKSLSNFGSVDPEVQEFNTLQHDLSTQDVVPSNIRTWMPTDESPAFYTAKGDGQYETLSYNDLHNAIEACPTWDRLDHSLLVVAVILPLDWMTETAVAQLCIMAGGSKGENHAFTASHPIDPRMNRESVIQTLNQLQVRAIVSTEEILEKYSLNIGAVQPDEDSVAAVNRLTSIRTVSKLGRGLINWSIRKNQGSIKPEHQFLPSEFDEAESRPILLLRTSGTTALPKIVPLSATALFYNAQCQGRAMELTCQDTTLNSMPLFHIGGLSCSFFSVLVSGSSAIYSGPFEGDRFLGQITDRYNTGIFPTWFNAVPTLHTALILHVNIIGDVARGEARRNKLRFIRSGASQLTSYIRENLQQVFVTKVINSFALSECMPVCVQTLDSEEDEAVQKGTVGIPVGPILRIADPAGRALPYGEEGEICIKGTGVIPAYLGIPKEHTHTDDGFLRTGDIGQMDKHGRVFLLGRSKDMIKRGGEQVWPAQVDEVVQGVDGVDVCVTFGVTNELWGEEVCSAVVLDAKSISKKDAIRDRILDTCRQHLDQISIPSQIIFIKASQLVKGPSGKYLRRKFAEALNVQAKDVATLSHMKANTASMTVEVEQPDTTKRHHKATFSDALRGLRIIVSLYVVMNNVGFYPNLAWEKIRTYNINIPIFFILGALHLTTTVSGKVRWSHFVGTRIGALHALFFTTQIIALPAFLLFSCAAGQECGRSFYAREVGLWVFSTLTGMAGPENSANFVTWYITVFYQFIILFPFLYRWTRPLSSRVHLGLLIVFLALATVIFWLVWFGGGYNPSLARASNYIVTWIPLLVATMMSSYFLVQYTPHTRTSRQLKLLGLLTDGLSFVLAIFVVICGVSPNCLWLSEDVSLALRPDGSLPLETRDGFGAFTDEFLYRVCDITWDEYDYIHGIGATGGRFQTDIALYLGRLRMGSPIVLLWLCALAYGQGLTARLLSMRPFVSISALTYHLYLLHMPISRFYIMASRGLEAKFWWDKIPEYPVPIDWYEVLIIIVLSLTIGAFIEWSIIPIVQPHTISIGVRVCELISSFGHCLQDGPIPQTREEYSADVEAAIDTHKATKLQVLSHIEGLTGTKNADLSTSLGDLGLDSLGTTALLSTLKAGIPEAKNLTIVDLIKCETVGDLIAYLNSNN